jgi:hypothetical protein
MAYYTPGVLELLEALMDPAKYDQAAMPFVVPVPSSLAGQPYRTLALELVGSGAVPFGLLRAGGGDSGNPLPYVVSALPSSTLALCATDRVYVAAAFEWALERGVDGGCGSAEAASWASDAEPAAVGASAGVTAGGVPPSERVGP